jgi:hypothetical protein
VHSFPHVTSKPSVKDFRIQGSSMNCSLSPQEGLDGLGNLRRSCSQTWRGDNRIWYGDWYLLEARNNPSVGTPRSDTISPHLDESDESIPRALEGLSFYSLQFDSSPESHICQSPWSPGGCPRNSGLPGVIFIECDIVCETIRR